MNNSRSENYTLYFVLGGNPKHQTVVLDSFSEVGMKNETHVLPIPKRKPRPPLRNEIYEGILFAVMAGCGMATFRYMAPETFFQVANYVRQVVDDPPSKDAVYKAAGDFLISPYGAICSAFVAAAGLYRRARQHFLNAYARVEHKFGLIEFNEASKALLDSNPAQDSALLRMRFEGIQEMISAHNKGHPAATRDLTVIAGAVQDTLESNDQISTEKPTPLFLSMPEKQIEDQKRVQDRLQPLETLLAQALYPEQ